MRATHRWIGCTLAIAVLICLPAWGTAGAQERISISGITEPISDVTLSLSVPGILSNIVLREGARVKKGQMILELDKRVETLEVERRKLVWESKDELEGAAARAETLKSLYESTLELFERTRSVSEEDLQKSELECKLAVFEHKRLRVAEERERIEYEMARENLRKRSLRSSIDGTVIKLFFDEGESCEEHQPIVQVVDTTKCRFVCNVEESLGRTLQKGMSVELEIRIGTSFISKEGRVTFVSPVVDPASGLLEAKVEFANDDGQVRPGVAASMWVNAPGN